MALTTCTYPQQAIAMQAVHQMMLKLCQELSVSPTDPMAPDIQDKMEAFKSTL